MKVVFRADASIQIGTGHVMRCMTLANELTRQGHECFFVCRDHTGHLGDFISSNGHKLALLPTANYDNSYNSNRHENYETWLGVTWQEDARQTIQAISTFNLDWLVVDHYALDWKWEKALASTVSKIMVIDDLANRKHDCDLLLDQNLGRAKSDYDDLLSMNCQRLIGPQYALLRPEFAMFREQSLKRRQQPELKRILISLGGVDKNNVTPKVLDALEKSALPISTELDIIMGGTSPHLEEVRQQTANLPFKSTLSVNVKDMAERMCLADIAIGAAGSTSWERCCLGLPSLLVILAENQIAGAKALVNSGSASMIDDQTNIRSLLPSLMMTMFDFSQLKRMSEKASDITDGNGVFRTVQMIRDLTGVIDD